MDVLILNQAFYPDVVSTAQHAADLATYLTQGGHQVTVLCNSHGYDDPALSFPKEEIWHGVRIIRVRSTAFGKGAKWRRAADFGTFMAACILRLMSLPRVDVVIAMTSPPLISFIASLLVPRKARSFVFWCMDLNPDEAIAAGWLRADSLIARLLSRMLLHSLRRADRIIALDRFMRDRIVAKGIDANKVLIVPPWSHDDRVSFDPVGREAFRSMHKLSGKFVVMYSGNHSPCHPLDTLLQAAEKLTEREDIVFCFVGGGSEFGKVKEYARNHNLRNVLCLPYQPMETLSASLSAADLHVVVMGEPFVGIVHPCKIYNILAVNRPFLYIGPAESHVSDIIGRLSCEGVSYMSPHGDVNSIVANILRAAINTKPVAIPGPVQKSFAKDLLISEFVNATERHCPDRAKAFTTNESTVQTHSSS